MTQFNIVFAAGRLTLTHGFFLSMRGFAIRLPSGGHRPVDLNDLGISNISQIEFRVSSATHDDGTPEVDRFHVPPDPPTEPSKLLLLAISQIDETDILDKSKGDAFSKAVALFQVLWFIIQYGVRAASHLPATAVEVMTLAFAALNIAMYIIWWKKPLLVERPIVVGNLSEVVVLRGRRYNSAVSYHKYPSPNLFQKVRDTVMPEESKFLWSDRTSANHYHQALCVSALMAMVFGALHCLAWEFSFPSNVEKIFWNTSSTIATIVPLICGVQFAARWSLVILLGRQGPESRFIPLLVRVSVVFYHYVLLFLALVYVAARMVLLVLPFVLLRHLSPDVYCTISWTAFLPHIST